MTGIIFTATNALPLSFVLPNHFHSENKVHGVKTLFEWQTS